MKSHLRAPMSKAAFSGAWHAARARLDCAIGIDEQRLLFRGCWALLSRGLSSECVERIGYEARAGPICRDAVMTEPRMSLAI